MERRNRLPKNVFAREIGSLHEAARPNLLVGSFFFLKIGNISVAIRIAQLVGRPKKVESRRWSYLINSLSPALFRATPPDIPSPVARDFIYSRSYVVRLDRIAWNGLPSPSLSPTTRFAILPRPFRILHVHPPYIHLNSRVSQKLVVGRRRRRRRPPRPIPSILIM